MAVPEPDEVARVHARDLAQRPPDVAPEREHRTAPRSGGRAGGTLAATDVETARMAIDPSDHGRPVVGASAIPGGYYARGNGRGELMNGTASGFYLAGLLLGDPSSAIALPRLSRMRAYGSRKLRPHRA